MIIKEKNVSGKNYTLETGRLAKQSDGSILASSGDTVVLATVVASKKAREGADFVPLSVEFREKFYSSGKIPGGFLKREGRLGDREVLTSRLIDRQIRPLLPKNWYYETQVIVNVLSYDPEHQPDVLGAMAASAALSISDIPFAGPVASVRVARVAGEMIVNPGLSQMEEADLEIIVSGSIDSIMMVEGELKEVPEAEFIEALRVGQKAIVEMVELQNEIISENSPVKREHEDNKMDEALVEKIHSTYGPKVAELISLESKHERADFESAMKTEALEALAEEFPEKEDEIKEILHDLLKDKMRAKIIEKGIRVDGRKTDEIRKITTEVGILPRTHGSSVFTRGETQALVVTTLGAKKDSQLIDNIDGDSFKTYMLQYNFPPFSTGEARMIRGVSRREIGHGNLAERALKQVLPEHEEFPYTIRIVSDILESNGSSSMATVCGGCMSLLDAGVPLKKMVSGIAMGLIAEGDKFAVLSDILGEEDHYGDMDFKVTGTEEGITAIQMDLKIHGLSLETMEVALQQARNGRLHILGEMKKALDAPRADLSKWAPRITALQIDTEKIGTVIGPGGKMIKHIVAETEVQMDIDDDGMVHIFSNDSAKAKIAEDMVRGLVAEPEVGKIYDGRVTRLMDFGAFVEFMPGKEGLVHISELKYERVDKVSDMLSEGDEVKVKLMEVDNQGRKNLSIRRTTEAPEGWVEPQRSSRPPRRDGGRDRNRSPRR